MREIEKGYEKSCEMVDEINELKTGKTRISAYKSIATMWMPEILSEFKRLHLYMEIQLYEGNACELERWLEEDKNRFGNWDFS